MNWPPRLVVFVSQGRHLITDCVRTHCVGLTLLNCYSTFLLRKKELEQARQPYLFCARKNKLYALRKLVSWLMFQLCPRTACPRDPAEKLTELSIIFVYFGQVRISPSCVYKPRKSFHFVLYDKFYSCFQRLRNSALRKRLDNFQKLDGLAKCVPREKAHDDLMNSFGAHGYIQISIESLSLFPRKQIAARSIKMYFKFTSLSTC